MNKFSQLLRSSDSLSPHVRDLCSSLYRVRYSHRRSSDAQIIAPWNASARAAERTNGLRPARP